MFTYKEIAVNELPNVIAVLDLFKRELTLISKNETKSSYFTQHKVKNKFDF